MAPNIEIIEAKTERNDASSERITVLSRPNPLPLNPLPQDTPQDRTEEPNGSYLAMWSKPYDIGV